MLAPSGLPCSAHAGYGLTFVERTPISYRPIPALLFESRDYMELQSFHKHHPHSELCIIVCRERNCSPGTEAMGMGMRGNGRIGRILCLPL